MNINFCFIAYSNALWNGLKKKVGINVILVSIAKIMSINRSGNIVKTKYKAVEKYFMMHEWPNCY